MKTDFRSMLGTVWAMNCLTVLVQPPCANAQDVSISDVSKAWTARESRIRSATFLWDEAEFVAAHSRRRIPTSKGVDRSLPHADVTVTRTAQLLIDQDKIRYSYEGQVYNENKGGIRTKQYISICDGETSKNFHRLLGGDQEDYPLSGFINDEPVLFDINYYGIAPLTTYIRPCTENLGGIDLADFAVSQRVGSIGVHTCAILQPHSRPADEYVATYWIDPARDFVVLRLTYGRPDRQPRMTIDIDYLQQDGKVWIPAGWTVIQGTATVSNQLSAKVTHFELDKAIDGAEFRFEFPPGTAVVDHRSHQKMIARENGDARLVTEAELARGATYRDLVTTESGKAATPNSKRRYVAIVLLSICVVLFTAVFYLVRRVKHE